MTQYLLIASLSILTLCGCSEADGNSKKVSKSAEVTKVSEKETPKTSFVNGITDANNSAKKGPITITGSVPNAASKGMVYLSELEGKNAFLIDSTAMKAGKFTFGTKEYETGFYQLGFQNDNNVTTVILNPDEPEITFSFKAARLANGFPAPIQKRTKVIQFTKLKKLR